MPAPRRHRTRARWVCNTAPTCERGRRRTTSGVVAASLPQFPLPQAQSSLIPSSPAAAAPPQGCFTNACGLWCAYLRDYNAYYQPSLSSSSSPLAHMARARALLSGLPPPAAPGGSPSPLAHTARARTLLSGLPPPAAPGGSPSPSEFNRGVLVFIIVFPSECHAIKYSSVSCNEVIITPWSEQQCSHPLSMWW